MQILIFDNEQDWLAARLGKVTGTRLKDIVVKRGTGKKIGFYELIAERIGSPADGENPMERGLRLEEDAIARFEAKTEKKVERERVIWVRDDDNNIAVSPDGVVVGKNKKKIGDSRRIEEAVEIKCLGSARHIEAYLTQEVPDEYKMQVLQYFIVNEDLKKLNLCFYDPRLRVRDFFILELTREAVQGEIDAMLEYQRTTLKEVEEIVDKLLSF